MCESVLAKGIVDSLLLESEAVSSFGVAYECSEGLTPSAFQNA